MSNWIKVEPTSGTGNTELKVTISANYATSSREGSILYDANGVSIKSKVNQAGGNPIPIKFYGSNENSLECTLERNVPISGVCSNRISNIQTGKITDVTGLLLSGNIMKNPFIFGLSENDPVGYFYISKEKVFPDDTFYGLTLNEGFDYDLTSLYGYNDLVLIGQFPDEASEIGIIFFDSSQNLDIGAFNVGWFGEPICILPSGTIWNFLSKTPNKWVSINIPISQTYREYLRWDTENSTKTLNGESPKLVHGKPYYKPFRYVDGKKRLPLKSELLDLINISFIWDDEKKGCLLGGKLFLEADGYFYDLGSGSSINVGTIGYYLLFDLIPGSNSLLFKFSRDGYEFIDISYNTAQMYSVRLVETVIEQELIIK